jgi:hypothetical protein
MMRKQSSSFRSQRQRWMKMMKMGQQHRKRRRIHSLKIEQRRQQQRIEQKGIQWMMMIQQLGKQHQQQR